MKRTLSIMLVIALVLAMLPATASASASGFVVNFIGNGAKAPLEIEYDVAGWEVDKAGTCQYLLGNNRWTTTTYLNDASGLYVYFDNKDADGEKIALNFNAPESGWYDIVLNVSTIVNYGSKPCSGYMSIWIDGQYIGQINTVKGTGANKLRPLYLEAGKHSFFLHADEAVGEGRFMRTIIKDITFNPTTAEKAKVTASSLALENNSILTEESTNATATLSFGTGANITLFSKSTLANKYPSYQTTTKESFSLSSDKPSVASVSGNAVTGVSEGTANITVTANLGDIGTYTKSAPVEVRKAYSYDFNASLAVVPSSSTKTPPHEISFKEESGIKIIQAESSTFANSDTRVYDVNGTKVLQLDLGNTSSGSWLANNGARNTKWTIKVPVDKAGWYNVGLIRSLWWANGEFSLYVDDQYAGYYAFTTDKPASGTGWKMSGEDYSNTLYLTPDEDGYVKVMLAFNKDNGYGKARLQLSKLLITPTKEQTKPTVSEIVHTIPSEVTFGEPVTITAYAKMSDGTLRRANGYTSAATADSRNCLTIAPKNSGDASIKRTNDPISDDVIYEAEFTANTIGKVPVTIKMMVDGEEYTEEVIVNSAAPEGQSGFTVNLTGDNLVYKDQTPPSSDWTTKGFNFVLDKTTTTAARRYTIYTWGIVTQFNLTEKHNVWPAAGTQAMVTISRVVPSAGYYSIDFSGYKWSAGAVASIYVNGDYAGDFTFYSAGQQLDGTKETKRLNTLYLPEGTVEISMRARKGYYPGGTVAIVPISFDFTPAEIGELSITELETSEIPSEIEKGESFSGTAKVKMNDGNYRSFGYTDSGEIPSADDVIKVTSSNPSVVAVSEVVCVAPVTDENKASTTFFIDPTTTTYKLEAVKAGQATITVTAIVDGKEKTYSKEVSVPDRGPGEAAAETVNVYVGTTVGGTVSATGVEAGQVNRVIAGKSVKAVATANEGYEFTYWKDSLGNYVSDSAEYNFKAYTNTSIVAVFDSIEKEDAATGVDFFDGNRTYLGFKAVASGTLFKDVEKPTAGMTGYEFIGWSIGDKEEINSYMRAVALYKEEGKNVSGITVNASGKSANYGDEITSEETGAKTWYRDGKLVGYGSSYTYLAWGETAITSSTEDVETKLPLVVLNKSGDAYMIEYENAGYEIVDAGIIFGSETNNAINSCYYKAKVRDIKAHGQFTAKKSLDKEFDQSVVRGYIIFKDTDGSLRIIYAD